ncbi:hypothetical protein K0817_012680 [Microbacterium sp. HD4P20]|uniref:hypothetical protein n=1 Tax=Microbacterium sp. HD4P20 TaxID=2864874 RepID=UPI001C64045E|nr:hypothetical protein [Microbacterium sp. HD4P20]MCP2637410.1 hypothetical protein [Microbacterium sp. HD4P20]
MEHSDAAVPDPFPEPTDDDAAAREQRRPGRARIIGWLVGVGLAALLAVAVGFVHTTAHREFDAAARQLAEASVVERQAQRSLNGAASTADAALTASEQIVASAADDLADPAARTALAESAGSAAAARDEASAALENDVDDAIARKPFWTWELFAGASALADRAADATTDAADLSGIEATLEGALDAVSEAAGALFTSTSPASAALEAANVSAQTGAVQDFRDAAARVAEQTRAGADAAAAFSVYAARATTLKESAQQELAEKAGPLLSTRLEIEAYARSISGGVLLDFDWAGIVAGTGGNAGIGGTATWDSSRGGSSTITLSHSVAQWWPSADARALVTHEVGHSITAKCHELFDSQDPAANEEWATAWAISMGHTAEGNGVQAYGHPSQAMIDLAATCR